MRLNKRMAELGLCSRREADAWIERGWVLVNGEAASLGMKVTAADAVTLARGAQEEQTRVVTVLMHKPIGFVSGQAERGYECAAELFLPENRWQGDPSKVRWERAHLRGLAPAGRLDIDSTGLLVLTQDGRIARQLIGERSSIEKEYLVRVAYEGGGQNVQARLPPASLALLREGLKLDGAPLKRAQVTWQNPEQLRFVLREGKKRQIRRMCEQVGLQVTALKRVRVGRVILGPLPLGRWRYLGSEEFF